MASNWQQQGYATVLLLGSLSLSIIGLGFVPRIQSVGDWPSLWQDAMQLNDERRRLIYYSVDYVNLYGHGSAGPGHLPCPDTDIGGIRPGPNPPCGGADVATGKLPSGVSLSRGRIAFTSEFTTRSSYSVARGLVNNPALDINSGQWPEDQSFEGSNAGYVVLSRPSQQTRMIDKIHLKTPTSLWVRAWFVAQLLETKFRHCTKLSAQHDQFPHQPQAEHRVIAECESPEEGLPLSLSTNDCNGSSVECSLDDMSLLQWMLSADASAIDGDWHGVPINRHWFVDNGWLELASFHWEPHCYTSDVTCVLVVSNDLAGLNFKLIADVQSS